MTFIGTHRTSTVLIGAAVFFGLGILSGWFMAGRQAASCGSKHPLINPGIVCGLSDVIRKTGYVATREKLLEFIGTEQEAGRVKEVAVYFRDLEHGPVFGINELADFAPASLTKLPLALVYLDF